MPEPRLCTVRKTKPTGPMTVCHDMPCLEGCVELTLSERERSEENE